MKFTSNIGMLLLAILLILWGIGMIIPAAMLPSIILGILSLVAGIFLLIGK